ncbi:patellin-4-like isoform X2 [Momordica charantia]|uniref:Patellin-4-like isoform X2 n=1 Tax=Momordica charantia TaxID=3673 RepID=A0A6J1DS24_MOMCH|nr:patellin-4-like isoform X2 [Momordica charantia]
MVAERNGWKVYDEMNIMDADRDWNHIMNKDELHQHEDQEDPEKTEGDEDLEAMEKKMRKKRKKKALLEFRCRVEDAIIGNYLLGKPKRNVSSKEAAKARDELKEISLWGVPLLPSKGHEGTDILLLKFLKAKHYKVHDAFEMLRKTLKWRKEFKTDGILEEKLGGCDLHNLVGFLDGKDREGHPLWFHANGVLRDKEMYQKTFGAEDQKCDEELFLRWIVQNMEKGIKQLSFSKGGVDSIVQITDLKNSSGPAMKEFRCVSKKALLILQDNYPELVYKNIIINAPFWYYARHILRSKIITPKTKAKFVFANPSKVTKTLVKFIAPEQLPVRYGGLKREDDDDFSPEDKALELTIRGNTAATIEFPVAEGGVTMVWDVTVVGWDVVYKEEFVPEDEGLYRIELQNQKKVGESVRNSFYISEPGKIVITIENPTFNHKKTVFYRSKTKPTVPMYILFNK